MGGAVEQKSEKAPVVGTSNDSVAECRFFLKVTQADEE